MATCYQYSSTVNALESNTWHNIQLVKSDGVIDIFVDGDNVTDEIAYNISGDENISDYYIANNEPLVLGNSTSGDPQPLVGKMDRLGLWSLALDNLQVEYYANNSPSGIEQGLLGYWNFDQGDGDVFTDLTGNDNHGSIFGATWVEEEGTNQLNADNNTFYLPESDLNDNTNYFWQVTATDQSGATFQTPLQSFFVNNDNDNPNDFALNSPDSASSIPNTSEVLLFWDHALDNDGDPLQYELYFGDDPAALSLVDVVNDNYFHMQDLEEGAYYWNVNAFDDLGGNTTSSTWMFNIVSATNNAPLAFSVLAPSDGEELGSLTAELQWESTSDFDLGDEITYEVQLGINVGSISTVYSGQDTVYSTDTLVDNTTYYWRVLANDLNGASTENNDGIQSFRINSANDVPGDFALLFPEDESMVTDLTPTLMWEEPGDADDAVASMGGQSSPFNLSTSYQMGARGSSIHLGSGMGRNSTNSRSITSYDLYISLDSLLTDADSILVETNSYTPETDLLEDVVYYWKVVATDDDGGQTESAVHSFWTNNMNSAPAAFVLESPEQDEETGLLPTFSWTSSTDSDLYDELSYTVGYGVSVSNLTEVVTDSLA